MINLIAFATPPVLLVAVWLLGITTLSKGGARLAKRAAIGLLIYGLGIILVGQLLEAFNAIPRWIAGSEGYGIIIPLFVAGSAILGWLFLIGINSRVIGKHHPKQGT